MNLAVLRPHIGLSVSGPIQIDCRPVGRSQHAVGSWVGLKSDLLWAVSDIIALVEAEDEGPDKARPYKKA